MRKLYNEFFYVPKYGKGRIRERVMLMRTAITVVIMIVCLATMGITAYAYFTYNITSASNVIQAANFEMKVSIHCDSNNEPVTMAPLNAKTQVAALQAGNEYWVTIEKAGTAKTGFCVISAIGCDVEKYHTQQIGKDVKSNTEGKNAITFKLTVTDTTVVSFYSHWGTSSYYADYENKGENDALYIIDGETVTMQINGITNTAGTNEEEKSDEETTPEVTTLPETSEPTGTMEPSPTEAASPTTTPNPAESASPTTTPNPTEATASIETQPAEETTVTPTPMPTPTPETNS